MLEIDIVCHMPTYLVYSFATIASSASQQTVEALCPWRQRF
ncbi:unnamed protein product, partial [Penicillium nalgiovense]